MLFLVCLLGFTALAGMAYLLVHAPLPPDHPPDQTTYLLDANGNRLASLHDVEDRESVRLEDVPQVLVDAVLATEDKNFFEHSGVDPVGVLRATWNDIRNRSALQGGSTITQQYVKNAYLGRERTIWRKLREAALAIKVERKFDKREILERYLNTIYFGRGAYGVQAASRAYFGKGVNELGLKEASYLAGLIRAPELADARSAPEAAESRRTRTLAAMVRNGFITDADARQIRAIPLTDYVLDKTQQEPDVVAPGTGTDFFVDYVRRELIRDYGEEAVFGGGYRVTTTLDLELQAAAYEAVYGFLDEPATDPAGALVAINDQGEVKAMVGGRDWQTSKVNLAVGKEGGGTGRPAGSTFKPFLLAETVRQGYSVESALPGHARVVLENANAGKDWKVSNFDNADYGASVNLIDATRNSVNTAYAQLAVTIGAADMAEMAESLGISGDLPEINSLVLGTAEVSVLDMAYAFSTLANRGERAGERPRVIREVRTADGRVLRPATPSERTRVLDTAEADVVNFCLTQVVERGTGTAAKIGKPLIGKTGTSQDFADAWFVGGTRKLTTAVWMGYPEGNERKMRSVRGQEVTGGSFPASIFRDFMRDATRGADHGSFPTPKTFPGELLRGDRVPYSTVTSTSAPPTTEVAPSTTEAPSPTTTEVPATTAPAPTTTKPPPGPTTTVATPPTTSASRPPPPGPGPAP